MDLVPPRGDGVDHSDDNVKLELEQRGFFADQFEVRSFFSPPFIHPPGSRGFLRIWFTSYDSQRAHGPFQPKGIARVMPQLIRSLTNHTSCSRFLPPVGGSYVQGCMAS